MIQALGGNLVPVMAIACAFMFLVIWVVMATIDSIYKTACNARLKERLIERGASASEIDRIVRAGSECEDWKEVEPVPPVKSNRAYSMSGPNS